MKKAGYIFKRVGGKNYPASNPLVGTYYFCRQIAGKRGTAVSLRTKDRVEAEREATRLVGGVFDSSDEIARLQLKISKLKGAPKVARVCVIEAWGMFEASYRRPRSTPRALREYRSKWLCFAEWTKAQFLDQVDRDASNRFMGFLEKEKGLSPNSVNKHLLLLKMMWRVVGLEIEAELPLVWDIPLLPQPSVSKLPLTEIEAQQLIYRAGQTTIPDLADICLLAAHTGMRRKDAFSLRWESCDFQNRMITYRPAKTARHAMTAKVGMSVELQRMLSGRRITAGAPNTGAVFPDSLAVFTERPHAVDYVMEQLFDGVFGSKRVESATTGIRSRNVYGFHSFRHAFKRWMIAGRVQSSLINLAMCHEQGTVAAIYDHVDPAQLVEAAACLPSLMGHEAIRLQA